MKVLLTGANGQLGKCFLDRLPKDWDIWATDTSELDITDRVAVLNAVENYKPDAIVNAAAYTAVDKAESDSKKAELVNKIGPENLAIAAARNNSFFIHVSTDYVFDGTATQPYKESDMTNPLGVYGSTKLMGEKAVERSYPQAIILRTAWVFSEYGNNFVKTMLRLGKEKKELNIVSDQRGCPTYAGDIAQSIIELLRIKPSGGIYHYCGDREVSWSEFAKIIFESAIQLDKLEYTPVVNAITTEQYPTPAKRPLYSTLSNEKINKLGIKSSDWVTQLNRAISKI
ncbi:dTDP-4-dehydrorhamnose reductase [Raoultella ornithinolytica]|uniref:dTDP-4-dehydrorhamnose reductase n=1 Tax=Raoultella ornithinolytica TaxID=54291 RepID=UPI0021A44FC0|nr:dTDP-4-dehydrorhamnose reductase [Raoultella ornithinolytica]MCT1682160.1 dTDP-4-dehydrorhamnose reductase [Raoultella ornithinolytica]MEB8213836.1 dTDP-4-dehydrorhamnose reductase [Raoultella ornithinolytica]HEC2597215.1 dTDP-4-dehydrorhamnose reductase [Raoultella ornithinolytica]